MVKRINCYFCEMCGKTHRCLPAVLVIHHTHTQLIAVQYHKTLWHAPPQTNTALKVSLVFYPARAVRTLRLRFFSFFIITLNFPSEISASGSLLTRGLPRNFTLCDPLSRGEELREGKVASEEIFVLLSSACRCDF